MSEPKVVSLTGEEIDVVLIALINYCATLIQAVSKTADYPMAEIDLADDVIEKLRDKE